ncbi:MAG: glycosyl transferase family 90 [Candidatus Dependentiae bacterium]|nr:glycosyl transferase family 90 [Candidatus Dependentiae bacterium]
MQKSEGEKMCPKIKIVALLCLYWSTNSPAWQERLKQKIAEKNTPSWMCTQIKTDLQTFGNGITREMLDSAQRYTRNIVHVKIINNQVHTYTNPDITQIGKGISAGGNHLPARHHALHKALQDLITCITLPDIEFLVVISDGIIDTTDSSGPLFAFSKHRILNNNIILMPDPDVLENYDTLYTQALEGSKVYPWAHKIKKAFWRGGANHQDFSSLDTFKKSPRFNLVATSKAHPFLIDALFTSVDGSAEVKHWLEKNNFLGDYLSIKDHLQYAYQIQIDGFTAAWARMYWQLFCNAIMLKQESNNIQWYYEPLQPYVHYIPLAHDVADIEEKITWADTHNQEVQQIIKNANTFANNNLGYPDILLYIYTLLTEYAKLQHFKPSL